MENLIYSLNATIPVFLVILAGYILRRAGWINENFIKIANKINFKITLPCLLVQDLMGTDIKEEFDLKYILFCASVTTICFVVIWGGARLFIKDRSITGAFVQASFRGSAAVLGTAFVINIYGNSGMVPLMMIGAVPLYNIFSVIVLEAESNGECGNRLGNTVKGILTNPIIISIFLGLILSLFDVSFPTVIDNTIGNFAKLATPLALIAIGGTFDGGEALAKIKPAVCGSLIKILIQPIIFLPIAVMLGFRDEKLMALIIMLGSPTTPSCYIMAKNMNNDGVITTSMVVITTVLSAFTITGIIFVLKTLGYL